MLCKVKHASDAAIKSHMMFELLATGLPCWWVTLRTTSSTKTQESKLCPQARSFVSCCGCIRIGLHFDSLWLVSATSPTMIHYFQVVRWSSWKSWQDFPPHFSLVLLIHLNLFLPCCPNSIIFSYRIFFSPLTEGRLIYLSIKEMPGTKGYRSLGQIRSCLKEAWGAG